MPSVKMTIIGLLLTSWAVAQSNDPSAKTLVQRMLNDSEQFQAEKLHAHGLAGLTATLDRMFPDTVPLPKSEIARVKRLAKQLSSKRFQVRQKASDELIKIGPPTRKYLVQVSKDAPLEVVRRAGVIMEASGQVDDVADDVRGFSRYIRGVKDVDQINLLAERVATALQSGMPKSSRRAALKLCLAAVVRNSSTDYSNYFEPLLKRRDVSMVVFMVDEIGSHVRFSSSFPRMLVNALSSDHQRIRQAGIRWAPECLGKLNASQVERCLRQLFKQDNERLKFHASFALIYAFRDRTAWKYILSQTQSHDRDRALTAVCWIGDECNRGTKATPQLIANLEPLLHSDDIAIRLTAIRALGMYRGQVIVRQLAPFLSDEKEIIAETAAIGLCTALDPSHARRSLYRLSGRQEIIAARGERRENIGLFQNDAEPVLLTNIVANVDSTHWQGVRPREEESLFVKSRYGVLQQLDRARMKSRIAKKHLWLALREEDEAVRSDHAKVARDATIEAGIQYGWVLRRIETLRDLFGDTKTPSAHLVLNGLTDAFAEVLLERGLTYLDQARSYIRYRNDERQNLTRARMLKKADETLRLLTAQDAENPLCWLGVAWLIGCAQLATDPDEASRMYLIVHRNKHPAAQNARRMADYFFVVGLWRNPTFAKVSRQRLLDAKKRLAQDWLRNYAGYLNTPVGWAVRYELGVAYYLESTTLLAKTKDEQADDAERRDVLLRKAEKWLHEVAESSSEFAAKARRLSFSIRMTNEHGRSISRREVDWSRIAD